MGKFTEEEMNRVAGEINDAIRTLPVDGFFKVRIKHPVSAQSKMELTAMMEQLAKSLGRPDITIIIEGSQDLN